MTSAALVGREREVQHLRTLIAGVEDRGGVLVLHGEAGVGKSTLVAEARRRAAASDMRVLATVGVESEQHLPYAGLHQLVFPVRSGIDNLPVSQRDALRAVTGLSDQQVPDIYLVGLAVLNLLAEVAAEAPLLLVAEDAHWLDQASVDVLTFVARRLESEPILLLVAVRDGTPARILDAELPSLAVAPLSDSAAETLLDLVAPGLVPVARRRLLDDAAGNPLALTELPKAVQSGAGISTAGPLPLTRRLERTFTARLALLPPDTRSVLPVAALNDSAAASETLAAAASVLARVVTDAVLAPAVSAQLIVYDGATVTFRHPLMRSAVVSTLSGDDRRRAHAALAAVLGDQPDRRAWHRAAATPGPDEDVAVELDLVAQRAQRRGVVDSSIIALEEAARLSTDSRRRAERLLRAADLAVESGRRDIVQRVLAEVESLELSGQQQTRVAWIRGSFDDGMRDPTVGAVELARLAEAIAADGDHDLAVRILWSAALRCFWSEPGTPARQYIEGVADALLPNPEDPRLLAILAYAVPIERGSTVIAGLARPDHQAETEPREERFLGTAALLVGALDHAVRLNAASVEGLRAQGRLALLARARAAQAWSATRLGDLAVAIPAADEARRLTRETDQPFVFGIVRASQAEIAALRGEHEQAAQLAAEAERAGMAVGARPILATVQTAKGISALAQGRFADAFNQLRRMHDPSDPAFQVALRCYALPELADAAVRSGQADVAAEIVDRVASFAETNSSPAMALGVRYARAVLADADGAQELFEQALSMMPEGWPFQRAWAQLAYGEWLRRQRRTTEARPMLRSARETFDALGIIPWSERARNELRAAGEGSPRRVTDVNERLTAHELHIAQLAADGLTNREIGQRLYLSHRTVSTHLHRIFPKLGVTSRAELAAVLHTTPPRR
ncbi:regulatory protein, luxR family [Mycolicibacterium rutilum]|uniref:Regulatory protein, luxR family n=1 Tax=Mycolicibacterium rutilum TaxID=370526 RepID=A0A1H6J615_MYCRU|nr:LuxR family transcriptional regulator [Mycolicibacterium rutilum]SEH54375.1 regulatory protein, luxR family [Mycolicibacterium rutilum]